MEIIAGLSSTRASSVRELLPTLGDLAALSPIADDLRIRHRGRRVKPGEVARLLELYRRGVSVGEIAAELDLGTATVLRKLAEHQEPSRPFRKVCGELLSEIRCRYEAGQSLRALADEFSVTRGAVRNGLVAAGVAIRSR